MAFKKLDMEFCLTDDSVNCYGYRLLTSGLQLEKFEPAIGFFMHRRDEGVAVRWEDFRTEIGKLYAKPVVNTELYPQLAGQIEAGFYAAASVGHIVALEVSDDGKYRLEGQTGPTVLKWFPRECSIVDIPGNYNALAKLYDENDGILHDLSANFIHHKNNFNMDKTVIDVSAFIGKLPDLKAGADEQAVFSALAALSEKAGKYDTLEKEFAALKAAQTAREVKAILDRGLAERRLTKELSGKLEKDYAGRPQELQSLVDAMPAQTLVTENLDDKKVPEKYAGKSFNDLYLSGELSNLKADYPDYYAELKNQSV